MARTLDDIVAALKLGKHRNTGCTLLIGAGCSKTAGIPLASGIVDQIRNTANYSRVYQRALDRARASNAHAVVASYGDCMAEMDHGDQRELIRGYIDAANLNWAHAGIAALIKHGYVGRVLTTNFDPLVARACAVFNELPAVYDLTMSQIRNYKELPDKAIFHLHGQRYGFSMLNDPDELEEHKNLVKPLFEHAREMRTWIVCGYSGENDPLFELIKACDRYDHALYWIGRDNNAPDHLQSLLSGKTTKGCHYLQFDGADEFFLRLCGALDIADFSFMHRPLEHIEEILAQFVDFPTTATDQGIDLLQAAKASIGIYKAQISDVSAQNNADQKVTEMIATQGLESALSMVSKDHALAAMVSSDIRLLLLFLEGVDLHEKADECQDPAQKVALYQKACDKFAAALAIKPDMHEALYNWGHALHAQAQRSPDDEARRLWAEAGDKYAAALAIKPDMHEALNNWGHALHAQAQRSPDDEARRLWAEAGEKYAAALAIKPDMHEALNNWGNALDAQAQRSADDEARRLWAQAGDKFVAALAIKPDKHEALNNWGSALAMQAQRSPDDEARRLRAQAGDKFAAALAIKPDMHEALNNWGLALATQAQRSPDDKARRLWAEAGDKYAAALAIKADNHETLYNWGNALHGQAQRSADDEARRLWAQAGDKFAAALAIKPDKHEVLNNWGNALDAQAQRSPDDEARRLWAEAGDKYAAAHAIKPDKHEMLNNWSAALMSSAHRHSGAEHERLLAEAYDKASRAEVLEPGEAAYNLACIHAMRGELDDMTHWLDRCHAAGTLPTSEHMAADKDFDSVRETPQFKAWLSKMGWLD